MKCPTCGHESKNIKGPVHDVARRVVTFNGKTTPCLRWAGNLILDIMLCRHPETTHWEAAAGSVWAGRDVDLAANFYTQVCYLNRELKPLGVKIVSHKGGSGTGFYWLEW